MKLGLEGEFQFIIECLVQVPNAFGEMEHLNKSSGSGNQTSTARLTKFLTRQMYHQQRLHADYQMVYL
jgi:hypothetical protein